MYVVKNIPEAFNPLLLLLQVSTAGASWKKAQHRSPGLHDTVGSTAYGGEGLKRSHPLTSKTPGMDTAMTTGHGFC